MTWKLIEILLNLNADLSIPYPTPTLAPIRLSCPVRLAPDRRLRWYPTPTLGLLCVKWKILLLSF